MDDTRDTFYARDLRVMHTTTPQSLPPLDELRFGQTFTDHMFITRHVAGRGWDIPEIVPFGAIPLHPAAQVLHYGVSCFEGMKAFMGVDGRGRLFRPDLNMARLQRSAQRLLLADFDPNELLECLKELLRVDAQWLPNRLGYSMYIRPFMYSTGSSLGVARSSECALNVIMSPVGPYFKTGLQPVTLFLDERHVRAWPGGVGQYKIGGNYAPTLLPQVCVFDSVRHTCMHTTQELASRVNGTPQVVYSIAHPHSDGPDDALLSESGAMNFFVLLEDAGGRLELVTPPLDGTILPGVTRDSILCLTRGWGEFAVSERPISIREVAEVCGRTLMCHQQARVCRRPRPGGCGRCLAAAQRVSCSPCRRLFAQVGRCCGRPLTWTTLPPSRGASCSSCWTSSMGASTTRGACLFRHPAILLYHTHTTSSCVAHPDHRACTTLYNTHDKHLIGPPAKRR